MHTSQMVIKVLNFSEGQLGACKRKKKAGPVCHINLVIALLGPDQEELMKDVTKFDEQHCLQSTIHNYAKSK